MKHTTVRCTLASVLCFASAAAFPADPKIDPNSRPACTVANVAGDYGFSGTGTMLANPNGFPEGPVSMIGVITFDGHGGWKSSETVSFNGEPGYGLSYAGTYVVKPDCTFQLRQAKNRGDYGVFVNDRQEALFMANGPGQVITFAMKRVNGNAQN